MDFKKLTMLANIGKAMLEEAKKSEASKRAGIDIKSDIKNIVSVETGKKAVLDIITAQKAKVDSIKEMLNSEEAQFIKMAAKESDPGKKVAEVTGKAKAGLEKVDDLIPEKLKLEYINYKHWCINWFNIGVMGMSAPVPVIKGMLKYEWIYDLLKANAMVTKYVEGRRGANVAQTQKQLTYIIAETCDMVKYTLMHPDKVAIVQNMVPGELLLAMDIERFTPELIGTVIVKTDQASVFRYFDATDDHGLGADTCGLPRVTTGIALKNEIPQGCMVVASNLPCDGGLSSYETIQKSIGNVPIYRFSVPYDFRNDESMDTFAEDLKGLIKFLEDNTGKKMNWDKLREICGYYNEMVDIEYERWDLAKLDNPPLSNDCIWFTHYFNITGAKFTPKLVKHYRELLEMGKKAHAKGVCADRNMRYRTVVWNPPPSGYGHMWTWLERCWGIDCVMDLETYGHMEHIDLSTNESMLKGLGKRYMWAPMSKHTRGPQENLLGDLRTVLADYRPDFVLYPAHLGCKNSMSLEVAIHEECKKLNIPFCVFKYELIDNRISSRQQMRNDISKFMTDVMNATPLDASLLQVDDSDYNRW